MIRRTLGTLTDTDVKQRRTITLGTLTGRLCGTTMVGGRVAVFVDLGERITATAWGDPETPVEVRA